MKKKYIFLFCLLFMVTLITVLKVFSSNNTTDSAEYGIKPYNLTKRELYLLKSFGMENNSQVISFSAPKSAKSLYVNVYILRDKSTWEKTSSGAITLNEDMQKESNLNGIFTMTLTDNYAINFNINCNGLVTYKTDEIKNIKCTTQGKVFLTQQNNIVIGKEMPVALMICNNSNIVQDYSLEDFFNPSKFEEGNSLVQAVTFLFDDK